MLPTSHNSQIHNNYDLQGTVNHSLHRNSNSIHNIYFPLDLSINCTGRTDLHLELPLDLSINGSNKIQSNSIDSSTDIINTVVYNLILKFKLKHESKINKLSEEVRRYETLKREIETTEDHNKQNNLKEEISLSKIRQDKLERTISEIGHRIEELLITPRTTIEHITPDNDEEPELTIEEQKSLKGGTKMIGVNMKATVRKKIMDRAKPDIIKLNKANNKKIFEENCNLVLWHYVHNTDVVEAARDVGIPPKSYAGFWSKLKSEMVKEQTRLILGSENRVSTVMMNIFESHKTQIMGNFKLKANLFDTWLDTFARQQTITLSYREFKRIWPLYKSEWEKEGGFSVSHTKK